MGNFRSHSSFFSASENASVFVSNDIAQRFAHYSDGQINLSNAKVAQTEDEGVAVLFKKDGAALTLDEFSPQVREGIRLGHFIAAEITNPSVEFTADHAFDKTWLEYMEGEIIPYDREQREDKFRKAYLELDTFIQKWKSLQALGPDHFRNIFSTTSPSGVNLRL